MIEVIGNVGEPLKKKASTHPTREKGAVDAH